MRDTFHVRDAGQKQFERARKILMPGGALLSLRSVLQLIWMMMPPKERTVHNVEKEVYKQVDIVLAEFRNDSLSKYQGKVRKSRGPKPKRGLRQV